MNNHADRRAADEKDQERDRLERLIPAEKTFRFGYKPATSDSTDSSGQFEKMKSNICRGSKSKVEEPLPDTTSSLAWLHRLGYYGLALLLVMIGVLVRMLLTRLVGPGLPTYITFYPLVMLAALVGGWGPGLLATVATAVVADYWLLPPPGLFKVESSVDLVGLVFFCTMSVLGSVVAELYRRIRNRLEDLICLRTVAVSQANDQLQLQAEELQTQTEELAAANAALQQSEEKFKAIFYRAALGLAITDPTGHILDCNLVCQQIFDYTKGELLQKRFLDLTHPDDIRKDSDLQRQVNDGSLDSYQLEKRCLRRDGQVIWCNVIASAIRNPDGRCDFLSRQWIAYTGRSEAEQLGYGWMDQVHPDDRDRLKTAWDEAVASVTLFDIEFRIRRVDGVYRWFKTRAVPVCDAGGQVVKWFGSNTYIEDLKSATEALRQNEERFRQLAENIEEVFFLITPDWNEVLYISPAYERVWGRSCQSLYDSARSWLEAVVKEDRPAAVASMEQAVAGGLPKTFPEYRILRPDGTQRWILARCWPIFDNQGNIYRAAGIAEDTTERKQAEEALHELNATLENKVAQRTEELEHRAEQLQKLTLELTEAEERERTRIAEILHDDLQQVLVAAKFQVEIVRKKIKNNTRAQETVGEARDMLLEAIAKSRSLSHELSSPVLAETNLCEAFKWLAKQMQANHRFMVNLQMEDRLDVALEPLRLLLYKAAQEMLLNAIKHAGVSEARLRLRRRSGLLLLLVSDRGRGFDPSDSSCKLGFGLLSVRKRIELLGGRLMIRSAPGRGSTFFVVIPDSKVEK